MRFHTRHDRRYTFLQNRCTVFSAIFHSLRNYLFDRWKCYDDFFFFYPIKKTVPCNIAYNMFMINSFYQIGALFLPKGVNRSEINETNWANFIHCKIYISLYSCKKKERVIIPIIYLNSNLRSSISNSLYCMTLLLTCSSIWIFLYKLQRYYEEAGSHLSYSFLQFFLAKHAFENKLR